MKNFLVLSLFLFSVSVFGQATINFETVGQDYVWNIFSNGPTDSTALSVVDNPNTTGINTSAKCLKYIVKAAGDPWSGFWGQSAGPITLTADNCIITLMVYKDVISNFDFKLEPPNVDHNVANTLINQWEKLTFDYTSDIGKTAATITMIPDFPAARTAGSVNYIDNIEFIHSVVPVELTSFSANTTQSGIELKWSTATETNNKGFEVQKSSDSKAFITIGFVNGKGTTTSIQQYNYVDASTTSGKYYYRLCQVDFDGSYKYSDVVEAQGTTPSTFALSQNYPNPFNPTTTMQFSLASDAKVAIKVFDMLGREVANIVEANYAAGVHKVEFNASKLTSGLYVYQINAVPAQGAAFTANKIMTLLK
ncbi:MAG: T9SS type A sorting domain-containing protein [Ignavibacteriaceae bacterium]|nr:T9SS type A sorting domain-containing protein [Ignavibacteriaceae bacterium]